MPTPEQTVRIEAANRIVMAQTEVLHAGLGRAQSQWKSDGTRVTAVDIAISEAIVAAIQAEFPNDQVFSEELTQADQPIPVTSRFCWVLDPIDGTNNFAAGINYCAISLGLLENGHPVHGSVYDAARRVLIQGGPALGGTYEGERQLHVKAGPVNRQSTLGFHSPMMSGYEAHVQQLISKFKIRALGSSTLHLAYVAAGLVDATVDHNVKVWDIAAAVALCLGAGGEVHFMRNNLFPMCEFDLNMPRTPYYAASPEICAEIRQMLEL